ncbi:MAG TPA: hypothetical protein K8V06_04150 [Ligilactobacillus salivarius]|uniref:Uncharacterized protein n=1 Tax=Ligilactobacillus salivarius TaxID=1624 RepID=A0A921IEG6_9LACO|nr:hypothetical protein [Ligilactobacillus salivarius]
MNLTTYQKYRLNNAIAANINVYKNIQDHLSKSSNIEYFITNMIDSYLWNTIYCVKYDTERQLKEYFYDDVDEYSYSISHDVIRCQKAILNICKIYFSDNNLQKAAKLDVADAAFHYFHSMISDFLAKDIDEYGYKFTEGQTITVNNILTKLNMSNLESVKSYVCY